MEQEITLHVYEFLIMLRVLSYIETDDGEC